MRPHRRATLPLLCALTILAAASLPAGAAQSPPITRAAKTTTVTLRHTRLGEILTTSSGLTLYEFTRDRADKDSCESIPGCAQTWPPFESTGKPQAEGGVRSSLLSAIKLSGSAKQVIYDGHPLYLYAGDTQAGDTSYVGVKSFGGSWDALNASGHGVS